MSQESLDWLNNNVLIGFVDKRGQAWHYRAAAQGDEPNHYPGPIPITEVQRRLFDWDAIPGEVLTRTAEHGLRQSAKRMAVCASDTGEDLGIHYTGYEIHQYHEWLLEKVAILLDGGLSIGSAGLLKNRTQAWVSVDVPENVRTPEGVEFRPHLVAATSHDASLATTYKRTVTNVVCDNTMSAALNNAGQVIRVKHTRNSKLEALTAREALDMVQVLADDFAAKVKQLCQVDVSDRAFSEFLRGHFPAKADSKRSRTIVGKKRATVRELWEHDPRVAPWKGTAYGALQAVNTFEHHYATVRGVSRAERNMSNIVTSWAETIDNRTLSNLDKVLAVA
jgi:phage/plasmid-like protein (TIGR03299 family)